MTDNVSQLAVYSFKVGLMRNLIDKCLPAQVELFNRIYSDGVPEEKIDAALDLLQRTVNKNERLGRK